MTHKEKFLKTFEFYQARWLTLSVVDFLLEVKKDPEILPVAATVEGFTRDDNEEYSQVVTAVEGDDETGTVYAKPENVAAVRAAWNEIDEDDAGHAAIHPTIAVGGIWIPDAK